MAIFGQLIETLPKPVRILDVGGTNGFWEMRGWTQRDDVEITTVNLRAEEQLHANITPQAGDATNLAEYADGEFDIVFSNSVIEHLFTLENQTKMANEVRRVGRAYWVQTPNFWFPIEPHFHVPGWQWLPVAMRVAMLRRFRCGWRGPCHDAIQARTLVEEVRLMSKTELQRLFPDGTLYAERFAGMVKSWVVYDGFDEK